MLNKIIIQGRLVADPDYRQTQSGVSVCRIRVACERSVANKQTGERESDFIGCTCWRASADFVSKWFHKGDMILVEGSLHNNDYTDQSGVKHYAMDVTVDSVNFCGKRESASAPSQGAQSAGGQTYTATPNAPQQAAQTTHTYKQDVAQQAPMQIGDINDFVEILSDGEVPF